MSAETKGSKKDLLGQRGDPDTRFKKIMAALRTGHVVVIKPDGQIRVGAKVIPRKRVPP